MGKNASIKAGLPAVDSFAVTPGEAVVKEICSIVSNMCGIQLGERQFSMVESRLKSRMIRLGIQEGADYLAYLRENASSESNQLLSLITTHHTYFFREFNHFEFLIREGLARVIPEARKRQDKTIRVWSAACSRGQEVYTIGTFLDYHLRQMAPDLNFSVHGTDVDPESVKVGVNGVYHFQELKSIPSVYVGQNWIRGTAEIADYAKIKTSIRERCTFGVFNLVKTESEKDPGMFDLIFCRNVFIYFNDEQIKKCVTYLMQKIHPHGYLFVGISESLSHLNLSLDYVGPATYGRLKTGASANVIPIRSKVETPPVEPAAAAAADAVRSKMTLPSATRTSPAAPALIRVLCVDDSTSILSILKKVLSKETGFEVVGTALNGKEAIEKLKSLKVDAMTLDIHMPEMDGISYLKSQMKNGHPPVIMVSTVNRDNSEVAGQAIQLGASDYIEKPTLANLEERSDEIRAKIKTAVMFKSLASTSSFDSQFQRKYKVTDPENKIHLILGALQHKRKVSFVLKNLEKNSPPLVFLAEGVGGAIHAIAQEMSKETAAKVEINSTEFKPGGVYLLDFNTYHSKLKGLLSTKKISTLVWGVQTKKAKDWLVSLGTQSLFLEDSGADNSQVYGELQDLAGHVAPLTSYYSVAEEYLG